MAGALPMTGGADGRRPASGARDMTTRTILFDSPFLLGFDHTRAMIDRAARAAADSYPPYNVEQRGENAVRISLAVAGFGPDDLAITLEGRQLTIAGKRETAETSDQAFLHRGIAGRGFVRSFVLADGLEVEQARLENGLLHVDLIRPDSVATVRTIPITTG